MESFILDRISLLAGILRKSTETNDDNDSAPGEKAPPDTNMKLQDTGIPHRCQLKDIVWLNVISFALVNLGSLYGLMMYLTGEAPLSLIPIVVVLGSFAGMGITAGVHRLWSHRTYKATWQLRLILMIANTMAFQNSIFEWARDHRVHHRHTDTNADPHNASRGFFFSHMGWLMVRKHPLVKESGKDLDLTDLYQDRIVMFQKRNFNWFMPLVCFILPTLGVQYFLDLPIKVAFFSGTLLRWNLGLHGTWLVNSAAHIYGTRPYDKNIQPKQNKFVAIVAFGEGWHNFHHVFPWDYKTNELGSYAWNYTKAFIDFFAKIGWAYEMKSVSKEIIQRRAKRTGDGTFDHGQHEETNRQAHKNHSNHGTDPNGHSIWGWGDIDMNEDDKHFAIVLKKRTQNQ